MTLRHLPGEGRSMIGHGIHHGSLLVVDRSCDLYDGAIVIAGSADGFLIKQYRANPARQYSYIRSLSFGSFSDPNQRRRNTVMGCLFIAVGCLDQ
ncbi:LexA family protein [Microbulbifer sp. TYP-18]|uniref:LexA family protein n=1 Tax=Microbulbifer sp. TYP-18 TaxID=3230024 RepID=UPI0034C6A228